MTAVLFSFGTHRALRYKYSFSKVGGPSSPRLFRFFSFGHGFTKQVFDLSRLRCGARQPPIFRGHSTTPAAAGAKMVFVHPPPFGLRIQGTGVHHRADFRFTAKHHQKIAHHGSLSLFIREISDEYKTLVTQRTLHQIENVPCWLLVPDICNFTPLSRTMESEGLDVLVGTWLSSCKEIIERHHGMIKKYLGDGFLAYWTEEATTEEEIADAVISLKQLQQKGAPDFRMVLHFGSVAIGGIASMGEESLMGKEVNLVFKLEKLAGSLGERCGLSDSAQARIAELLPCHALGEHELKGFAEKCAFFAA